MKQIKILMRLLDFTDNDHPFGNKQGREVLLKLSDYIDEHSADIYEVSLEGIIATDASFPRESVISLAKMYKGEKGFYLTGQFSKDLLDNWHYAAIAKEQPLILKEDNGYKVIGPKPIGGAEELLNFIMKEGEVSTAKVVQKFGVSAQNASAKLKKLFATGLILGRKTVAESGGLEFVYRAIK
ncbi:MarR family transcriptional regulator [Methylophaga nitratireducenticrescens]|nr:helix-turn-helix domain-containing protein [Methylophaga nitratireducenticrescens]